MNALVTRRGLLGATAALGTAVLPTIAMARISATSHDQPDATLLDLIARHREAVALTNATARACDVPLDRFHALAPARPGALDSRAADHRYDLGGTHGQERRPDGSVQSFYTAADVERLKAAPPLMMWGQYADDEAAYRVPDPVGEARRQEIVQASDDWAEARAALSEALGLRAANQACDAALEAEVEVEGAIVAAVPATLEGFRAKAAWTIASPSEEAGDRALDLLRALASIGGVVS